MVVMGMQYQKTKSTGTKIVPVDFEKNRELFVFDNQPNNG